MLQVCSLVLRWGGTTECTVTGHRKYSAELAQEVMNRHAEERWTSVPILYRITLQNVSYMDFNLLMLTSFEVTTVTTMDSQEPACCYNSYLLGFLTK